MTLYEFNSLELNERIKAVNQHGNFFKNHIVDNEIRQFYSIGMFFTEVVYNTYHNRITEVKSFRYGDLLSKYSGNFD